MLRTLNGGVLHLAVLSGNVKLLEQLLARKPELIDAEDQGRQTALGLACCRHQLDVVAFLLAQGPTVVKEEMLWDVLRCGALNDSQVSEIVRLLHAHKPELIENKVDGHTLLHKVFGFRNDIKFELPLPNRFFGDRLFREESMRTLWQLSPPQALRATHSGIGTPFDVAIGCGNKFAIELVQGKLTFEEIVTAFAPHPKQNQGPFLSLLDRLSEWVHPLNRDLADAVWEYLGFERPANKKRAREM